MKSTTQHRLSRILAICEISLLLGYVAIIWIWRWQQIGIAPVDPDEVFFIGGVDRMARGLLPYIDHAEAHMPLVSHLLVPLWKVVREQPDFLVPFRILEWCVVGLAQFALGAVAWRFGRVRAGAWTLGLLNAFGFALERSVQIRFEPFATILVLAAFGVFATRRKPGFGIREGVAAVLMGLATASHVSGPFLVAAFALTLLALDGGSAGVRAARSSIAFGVVAVGTWLGVFAIVLGGRLWTGLAALRDGFDFDAVYQAALKSDLTFFLPGILRESPVTAALCILLLITAHDAILRQRHREPALVLAVLLADCSLAIVLTRTPDYPQRYLPLATYGALVAGLEVARRTKVAVEGVAGRLVPILALLAALAVVVQARSVLSAPNLTDPEFGVKPDDEPVPRLSDGYRILPGDLLLWWDAGRAAPDAFRSRSIEEYRSVVRFLKKHSGRDDRVFTDWMNPPIRELPALNHHGGMIDVFERSRELAASPAVQSAYRRYNPDYRSSTRAEESFAILFDRTNTRLIALDGSMGRAFRNDGEFRRWMTERYDLMVEPRSEIVFAVRR
ncbi:MAG: hypothetical protein IT350_16430 [Deltaproteobacteria bacterium]|nr:hypothetical protein [Deltaproteobacteria bacterium]